MSKKSYYMVLDTETVTDARIPYDIAWILVDRKGEIIERFDALTAEVMCNKTFRYLIECDSFSKRKAAFYLENTPAQVMLFYDIMRYTVETIEKYDATVVAYNASFDVRVLNNYANVLFGHDFFNIDTFRVWDLWNMALNTICDSSNYVRWCEACGFRTDKGHLRSNAESVYSYLSGDTNFSEEHTALADCEIESEILQKVFRRKQKLYTGMCGFVCHQPVWKNRLAHH